MIHLIAPRIKIAEHAAFFLKLPAGSWRFVVEERHIQSVQPQPGDLFIWVNAPRYVTTPQDDERQDYIAAYIKQCHIQTLEYTLP